MLESAKPFRGAINHNKSRLAYYEQMRETMTQQDNRTRLKEAETRSPRSSGRHRGAGGLQQPRPRRHRAGGVAESLVTRGGTVKAGEPCVAQEQRLPGGVELARRRGQGPPARLLPDRDRGQAPRLQPVGRGRRRDPRGIELPNDPNLTGKTAPRARPAGRRVLGARLGARAGGRERPPTSSPPAARRRCASSPWPTADRAAPPSPRASKWAIA